MPQQAEYNGGSEDKAPSIFGFGQHGAAGGGAAGYVVGNGGNGANNNWAVIQHLVAVLLAAIKAVSGRTAEALQQPPILFWIWSWYWRKWRKRHTKQHWQQGGNGLTAVTLAVIPVSVGSWNCLNTRKGR